MGFSRSATGVANVLLRAGVGNEIAKDAGWTGNVAVAVDRAHDVAATVGGAERFENGDIIRAEAAAGSNVIGPHDSAAAVNKRRTIRLGDSQILAGPDRQTFLR